MAKHKRYPKIAGYHLKRIEEQFRALRQVTDEAMRYVAPMQPHYNAILDLHRQMWRTRNILNDRPEDYEEPHHAPMSQG